LLEDRKKAVEFEYMEIKRIKDHLALNKESLINLESDIKILRKRKAHLSIKLKDLYLKKLKEGLNKFSSFNIFFFQNYF